MLDWDDLIDPGQKVSKTRHSFHWELEFLEVFFNEHGRLQGETAGFDAVVGNPPYDVLAEKERQESLSDVLSYFSVQEYAVPAFG